MWEVGCTIEMRDARTCWIADGVAVKRNGTVPTQP